MGGGPLNNNGTGSHISTWGCLSPTMRVAATQRHGVGIAHQQWEWDPDNDMEVSLNNEPRFAHSYYDAATKPVPYFTNASAGSFHPPLSFPLPLPSPLPLPVTISRGAVVLFFALPRPRSPDEEDPITLELTNELPSYVRLRAPSTDQR